MLTNKLQQYLVGKFINEDHPTIEYEKCTNSRQRRKICTVCADICPKGVIGYRKGIEWDNCENCNICATQCPARAIKPSAINLGKLLEVYESSTEHVVIACRHRDSPADLKIYCISSTPWEVIAYLALEKKVVIVKRGCEECKNNSCLAAFEETIARAEEFLGAEKFKEQVQITQEDRLPDAPLMSRREMFALFSKRARNTARTVIPEDGSFQIDGMVYRKLLTKRIKELSEKGSEQTFGWRTRIFTEQCWGCGICAKVCPRGAIEVLDIDGAKYMSHSLWKCESCGICEGVCLENGISGVRVQYVKNPTKAIVTEITYDTCEVCGGAVKTGTGGLCIACAAKNKSTPFTFNFTAR